MDKIGYKAFNPGMICRGKQYEENAVFEEPEAKICNTGMHYCKNPFDVLEHYGFVNDNAEINEFAEVEALADEKTDDGRKFCTTKLKIGAKLSIHNFVNAFVEFTLKRTNGESAATNTGDWSAATNTGNQSAATNTGKDGVAVSWGRRGKARGEKGCYLVLAEYDDSNNLVCAKMEKVDGERIKENTFYTLKNGEFAVAEEQGAEK
nr:MAG TPA: hypothetical protein [Caudoviricetes sp.]